MENQQIANLETQGPDFWEDALSTKKAGEDVSKNYCLNSLKRDHFEQSLRELINEVSDKQRLVLEMVFVQRLRRCQVAKSLKISKPAISQIIDRAYKQLGKRLFYRVLEKKLNESKNILKKEKKMKKQKKHPWLNENGQQYPDPQLKIISQEWDEETWDNYLKATVDVPLQEVYLKHENDIENYSQEEHKKILPRCRKY